MTPHQQQQIADAGAAAALAAGTSPFWGSLDQILQTTTLALGVIAGAFAVYFHARRYWRERKQRE